MSKKLSKTIAVFSAECSANAEMESVDGVCAEAEKLGWRVLIFDAQNNFNDGASLELDTSIYKLLDFDTVDGVIIAQNVMTCKELGEQLVSLCKSHGVPVLSMGYKTDVCPCCVFSNADVLEQIVDHVIEKHNCTTLNLVAGIQGNDFSEQRVEAFKKSLKKHGLTFDERRLFYGEFWEGPTIAGMRKFFESGLTMPDAFICCNDFMAMTVCQELSTQGLCVPDDVIVTGYDGVEVEQYHTPRLTTAKCDIQLLGKQSFNLLVSLIEGREIPQIQELEPTIVFSQSCGCKATYLSGQGNFAMQAMSHFGNYKYRTAMLYKFATLTSEVKTLAEIKPILPNNSFYGANCWIMLNQNFSQIDSDIVYTKENPFSEEMDCFWQVVSNVPTPHDPISRSEYLPDIENVFSQGLTNLVFLDLYFGGESFGYMAVPFVDREPSITLSSMERFAQSFSQCCSLVKNRGRLEYMNSHDQLTNILNRRGFYAEIEHRIKKIVCVNGNDNSASLVIHSIDMNELKHINDTFGHSEGDFAIKMLSDAIVAVGGESVVAARFGGDEFVVAEITFGNTDDLVLDFRKRLCSYLDRVNQSSGKAFSVSVSCGSYTTSIPLQMRIDQIIAQADALMYKEKIEAKKSRL